MKKLKKIGLIVEAPVINGVIEKGRRSTQIYKRQLIKSEKIYIIKSIEIMRVIYNMLIVYKDSLSDTNSINIVLYLFEAVPPGKYIIKTDEVIDQVIKEIEEIFPSPFYYQ